MAWRQSVYCTVSIMRDMNIELLNPGLDLQKQWKERVESGILMLTHSHLVELC